jgi:DNA (cytosine-5)-methyltransferase 1
MLIASDTNGVRTAAQSLDKPVVRNEGRNIPVLSMFTGGGFLDIGFQSAGFDAIWHNEFSEEFVRGFEFGLAAMGASERGSRIQNQRSIIDVGPNEIRREAFGIGGAPTIFGVIGGPPCPDFSVGGKNRGAQGDRGKLSQVFISRIIELQPTFFLFENVPGLLRTAKHRHFLIALMHQLARHYVLDVRVLNALEYGVPQDRERVMIVGLRKDWARKKIPSVPRAQDAADMVHSARSAQEPSLFDQRQSWFPWNRFRKFANAKRAYHWPDVSPFGCSPERPSDCPEELMVGPYICDPSIECLQNGTEGFSPYSRKMSEIFEGDVSRKSFKRLHRWRYSPAAAYGNNEVHLHPTFPRRLTVREALRIQTVPDTYALPPDMSLSAKFKTIGNGVPVLLARAIAKSFALIFANEDL